MSADRNTSDPAVTPLTGSSPPGGGPPDVGLFKTGINGGAYGVLIRPLMRSASQRIRDLHDEHARIVEFYDASGNAEDAADVRGDKTAGDAARLAAKHAVRKLTECQLLLECVPAQTLHDLGLKARVLSWERADWWDERETEEPFARALVDDILNLSGVDRIRRGDVSFQTHLPDYKGAPLHASPDQIPTDGPAKSRMLDTAPSDAPDLADRFRDALKRLDLFDGASVASPKDTPARKNFADAFDCASNEVHMIEDFASYTKAKTAKEALLQTVLIDGLVDSLHSWTAGGDDEATRTTNQLHHRVVCLLHSIVGVLERISGVSARSIVGEYCWGRDPFRDDFWSQKIAQAEDVLAKQVAA